MEEMITKGAVGTGGLLASLELAHINGVLSAAVAIMTLIYLGVSTFKLLRKKDGK